MRFKKIWYDTDIWFYIFNNFSMGCVILIIQVRNTSEQSQWAFCLWNTMCWVSLAAIEIAILNIQKTVEWRE